MGNEYDTEHSLLEVEWGESPSSADLAAARLDLSLEVPCQAEAIPDAARELETIMNDIHINGGAELGVIRVPPNEEIDWYLSRSSMSEWFCCDLLASDALGEAVESLELPADRHPQDYEDLEWQQYPSYTLDGYLAHHLITGGAYFNFLKPPFSDVENEIPGYEHIPDSYGDPSDAKRLAERFVKAIFDDRYEEFLVCVTYGKWCEWFLLWETTYICFDKRTRLAWILVVTDVD